MEANRKDRRTERQDRWKWRKYGWLFRAGRSSGGAERKMEGPTDLEKEERAKGGVWRSTGRGGWERRMGLGVI